MDATPSSDAVCRATRACNGSEWTVVFATGAGCLLDTTGQPDSHVVSLELSDTVCEPLTDCTPIEEWMAKPPTSTSDRECQSVVDCNPATQFESEPPTFTSDRLCEQLTVCDDDDYIIVEHSITSDRECLPIVQEDLYTVYPSNTQLTPERRRDAHAQFVQLIEDYLSTVALAAGTKESELPWILLEMTPLSCLVGLNERQFVAYSLLDEDREELSPVAIPGQSSLSSSPVQTKYPIDAVLIIQALFGSSDNVVAFTKALTEGSVLLPDGRLLQRWPLWTVPHQRTA